MKKDIASQRQMNAVEKRLKELRNLVLQRWIEKNPGPSWKVEDAWRKANPSPQDQHNDKRNAKAKELDAKISSLIYDARVGKITADEFLQKVDSFKF